MARKLSKAAQAEQAEARDKLREIFAEQERPVVHCVLRHVSSSGMSRDISLLTVDGGELRDITYYAAKAMGENVKDRHGHRVIRAGGCGMDAGFHIVSNLSWYLYQGQERPDRVLSHRWA